MASSSFRHFSQDSNYLSEIYGVVGDFIIPIDDEQCSVKGSLSIKNDKVVFTAEIDEHTASLMAAAGKYRVVGKIYSTDITMFAYIGNTLRTAGETTVLQESIVADYILGDQLFDEGSISFISMKMPELTRFFTSDYFKSVDDSEVRKYNPPEVIYFNGEFGKIGLSCGLCGLEKREILNYKVVPKIEISFYEPVSFEKSLAKMAKVKDLFMYFADKPMHMHDMSLQEEKINPKTRSKQMLFYHICKTQELQDHLVLNIVDKDLKGIEESIWENWSELIEHKFITGLYEEVISNGNNSINGLINYYQAVELFEQIYRGDAIRERKNKRKGDCLSEMDIICDLLLQMKQYLDIDEKMIVSLAQKIVDVRAYFTHFNPDKKEPYIDDVIVISGFLHACFLILVYKQLGLPDDVIKRMIKRYSGELDISIILSDAPKKYYQRMMY